MQYLENLTRTAIVNFRHTLAQCIDWGHYDWCEDSVVKKFDSELSSPSPRMSVFRREVHFFLTDEFTEYEKALKVAKRKNKNFVPADFRTLLFIGREDPKLQLQYQLLAPGAVYTNPKTGETFMPCLYSSGQFRYLNFCSTKIKFLKDYLFLFCEGKLT